MTSTVRLLVKLGFRIGDPFDWEPTPWERLRLWASRNLRRKSNATCNACGYRGVRTRRGKWCPACYEDETGELIRDSDQPRHFIPYGSYFAPCDYIADQRYPERQTERRAEVTCAGCQSHMTNLGDLPPLATEESK